MRAVLEEAGRERPLAFISTGKPRDPEEHWGLARLLPGEREFAAMRLPRLLAAEWRRSSPGPFRAATLRTVHGMSWTGPTRLGTL